ncbi:RDD family protein [Rhodococcus sp. NPDC058521]|uniref:RDD family protein n=1 Tax=Rhodococcus sp. NPDC058521 TaxID=3346536 RepID=UPI00364D7622
MTTGGFDPNNPAGGQPGDPYGQPPQGYNPPPQNPGGNPPPPGNYPPPPPNFDDQAAYGASNRLPGGGEPGGLGIRFGARLIDGLLVGIVAFLLALVFGASDNFLVTGLFSGLLTFIYFVAFEVTQGWTPAKKVLGLSVHGPGGAEKPTLQQSAIRNAFTLLSIIPIIGGFLAIIAYIIIAVTINGSATKQGKHDELAGGTQVVKG